MTTLIALHEAGGRWRMIEKRGQKAICTLQWPWFSGSSLRLTGQIHTDALRMATLRTGQATVLVAAALLATSSVLVMAAAVAQVFGNISVAIAGVAGVRSIIAAADD